MAEMMIHSAQKTWAVPPACLSSPTVAAAGSNARFSAAAPNELTAASSSVSRVLSLSRNRQGVRRFADRRVPPELVSRIVECGHGAIDEALAGDALHVLVRTRTVVREAAHLLDGNVGGRGTHLAAPQVVERRARVLLEREQRLAVLDDLAAGILVGEALAPLIHEFVEPGRVAAALVVQAVEEIVVLAAGNQFAKGFLTVGRQGEALDEADFIFRAQDGRTVAWGIAERIGGGAGGTIPGTGIPRWSSWKLWPPK